MRRKSMAAVALAVVVSLFFCFERSRQVPWTKPDKRTSAPTRAAQQDVDAAEAVARAAKAVKSAVERASERDSSHPGIVDRGSATPTPTATATPMPSASRSTPSGLPIVMSPRWADGKFANFSPEELADMASRCELRWQLPSNASDQYVAAVRALYAQLTGDPDEAARASLRTMTETLRTDSDDDPIEVDRRLSAQRAGDAVTLSGSVYERYLQLQLDESDRAQRDGVPLGPKFTLTGCEPGSSIFRSTR